MIAPFLPVADYPSSFRGDAKASNYDVQLHICGLVLRTIPE
jgi:hypothetical protein